MGVAWVAISLVDVCSPHSLADGGGRGCIYTYASEFCRNCPQFAVVTGASEIQRAALKPIPIDRVFQVIGMDVMELPKI